MAQKKILQYIFLMKRNMNWKICKENLCTVDI